MDVYLALRSEGYSVDAFGNKMLKQSNDVVGVFKKNLSNIELVAFGYSFIDKNILVQFIL